MEGSREPAIAGGEDKERSGTGDALTRKRPVLDEQPAVDPEGGGVSPAR